MSDDARPLLVFFWHEQSGPAGEGHRAQGLRRRHHLGGCILSDAVGSPVEPVQPSYWQDACKHLARKDRHRLRVARVDVEQRPELARRFGVDDVPALVLLKDRQAVARLDGRTSAPRIEQMLEPHLDVVAA